MEMNFKTIKSARGNDLVAHSGFLYGLDKSKNGVEYYKCCNRNCRGRGLLEEGIFYISNRHHHPAQPEETERRITLNQLKDGVREKPTEPLGKIYNVVATRRKQEVPRGVAIARAVPPFAEIRTIMRHEQRKHIPPTAPEPENLVVPLQYRMIDEETPFVFQQGSMIMMASPEMLDLIGRADVIYMDGTFKVTPRQFTQIYSLHTFVYDTMVCCVYFLLPSKDQPTYINMFQLLQKHTGIVATRFQVDFEKATMQAIKHLFQHAQISGCFFHFTQCIWRKVQTLGLSSEYNDGNPMQVMTMVRRLAALPLLPHDDIDLAFESAKQLVDEVDDQHIATRMTLLASYVYNTWIKDDALYSREIWSRYNVEGPRTNNHLEGYHSGLRKAVGKEHPNLFPFLKIMTQQDQNNRLKYAQIRSGAQVSRRKPEYVRIENQIQRNIDLYSRKVIDITEFLDNVGALLKMHG